MLNNITRTHLSLLFLLLATSVLILNIQSLYIICPFAYIIIIIGLLRTVALNRHIQPVFFISFLGILFLIFSGAFLGSFNRLFFCTLFYYVAGFFFLFIKKQRLPIDIVVYVLFVPGILLNIFFLRSADIEFKPIGLVVPVALLPLFIFRKHRIINAVCGVALFLTASYVLYPMFIYKQYGTVTNQTDARVKLPLIADNMDTLSVNNISSKVIVLDYWYTGCGICFIRFPDLETMYKKYAHDKDVFIAAVKIPFKKEPNAAIATEQIAQYTFPKLTTLLYEDDNPWQINKFPYVLIFDKNKKLRYAGMLITENRPFVSNTYDLIEKLKNE